MKTVTPAVVKIAQKLLNEHYNANLVEDGITGPKTAAALMKVTVIPHHWETKEKIVAMIQHGCFLEGFDAGPVDGYWGPQTEYGYEQLVEKIIKRKDPKPWRDEEGIGATVSPSDKWPIQTEKALKQFYGPVGENQSRVKCPYPLKIAWAPQTIITSFMAHEKIIPAVERALYKVKRYYSEADIERLGLNMFGGCLNVRKMRGGSKWSTHAWGASIDWDPARNRLRWDHTRAEMAKLEYEAWWDIWESEGAVSLGRARDYDWMHVQFAKVR